MIISVIVEGLLSAYQAKGCKMRARSTLVLLSIVMMILLTGCGDPPEIRNMKTLMRTHKWEKATSVGQQYLEANPQSKIKDKVRKELAKCYLEYGKALIGERNFADAVVALEKVTTDYKEFPQVEEAMKELPRCRADVGRKALVGGNFIEAANQYSKLVEQHPTAGQVEEARSGLLSVGVITFNVGPDIWMANANGTRPKKIIENALDGYLSPEGGRIAFIRPKTPDADHGALILFDLATSQETVLLDVDNAKRPVISTAGDEVAVMTPDGFKIVGIDGTAKETGKKASNYNLLAGWLTDPAQLLVFHKKDKGGSPLLLLERTAGKTEAVAETEKGLRDAYLAPDGKAAALSHEDGLSMLRLSTKDVIDLVSTPNIHLEVHSVAFSTDSRTIMFVGKGKTDSDYRLYFYNKLDLKPLEMTVDGGAAPVPDPNRTISWSKGWTFAS